MVAAVATDYRLEKDSMGEVKVPSNAYYGAHTQRAYENFPISGLRFQRALIRSLGLIKQAAAKANISLGLLDRKIGEVIVQAAQQVIEGKFDDQFVVDVFQTGSGTSTNMNANEIIANRAIEMLGGMKGDKKLVHANDHVNMGQSTNDVFPTAVHLAALEAIEKKLIPGLRKLVDEFRTKEVEFENVVKSGRTHLQDALPVTLGQEMGAYAAMIEQGIRRLENAAESLSELPLGGTAVGTGLNAHPKFAELAIQEINRITGLRFKPARSRFEIMQAMDGAVETSGALKTLATSMMKIANDLRLLTSGPRTGFAEIELPATQPGSSIMPGKVNPVIPEAVNMVAAQVIGYDVAITLAGQAGQLELNTMMPIIAYDLVQSIEVLANSARLLAERCINGITADAEKCRIYAESSLALVTAIAPVIGYDNAARIFKKAMENGISIRQAIIEEKVLPPDRVDQVLDPRRLSRGGLVT